MNHRTHAAAIACLSLALTSSAAWAQGAVEADLARGVALRRQGQDQAALEVFQSAWRRSRAPRALAQVALAEQALGHWVDAEEHLVEALEGSGDAWVRSHLAVLQSALAEIRQHVGRLDVSGEPAGAEVVVDGRVLATLPLARPLRVLTGSVTFTVRRDGYVPLTRTVQVGASYPLREPVTLARVPPAVVAVEQPPALVVVLRPVEQPVRRTHTSRVRYAGYALLGTGAATLVVSGVFLGLNLSLASDAEAATPSSAEPFGAWSRFQARASNTTAGTSDAQCALAQQQTSADAMQVRDLCDRASTSATVALVAGIAGGAVALTGIILAAAGHDREETVTARWSVAPWFAQRTGGASLQGVW